MLYTTQPLWLDILLLAAWICGPTLTMLGCIEGGLRVVGWLRRK